MKSNWFF